MDKPNFINIKETAIYSINQIALDVSDRFDEEHLKEYLEKYECENVRDLIYLFLCQSTPEDLTKNLNMRKTYRQISDEQIQSANNTKYSDEEVSALLQIHKEIHDNNEKIQSEFSIQNEKIRTLTLYTEKLLTIIKENGIDVKKKNTPAQSTPSI